MDQEMKSLLGVGGESEPRRLAERVKNPQGGTEGTRLRKESFVLNRRTG